MFAASLVYYVWPARCAAVVLIPSLAFVSFPQPMPCGFRFRIWPSTRPRRCAWRKRSISSKLFCRNLCSSSPRER